MSVQLKVALYVEMGKDLEGTKPRKLEVSSNISRSLSKRPAMARALDGVLLGCREWKEECILNAICRSTIVELVVATGNEGPSVQSLFDGKMTKASYQP